MASVLLTSGQFLTAVVSTDDRKALLKAWIESLPVYGYVLTADAYMHSVDLDGTKTSTTEGFISHIGSRSGMRHLIVQLYRREGDAIVVERREEFNKSEQEMKDPYADLFAAPMAAGVQ
jgi:hypothetical protein